MPSVIYKIMSNLPKGSSPVVLNQDKLITFLTAVQAKYRMNVEYHNDLHGMDVAQMMWLFI